MSRLLGRRKIAVVEDDEESTFANPNDLGRASGLSDDFSVLDDDPNDLARMSGMSELARASGSLGLTRGPRGVDEMELLLGDIKKMAAKMRSKNQRRKDDTEEDSPSVVRSELALFDDLRHTLLDRDDTHRKATRYGVIARVDEDGLGDSGGWSASGRRLDLCFVI